tara:strand:+ start:8869 stop:10839 length:1971 start_codon:yes stop_codon:yes gene_type:complete
MKIGSGPAWPWDIILAGTPMMLDREPNGRKAWRVSGQSHVPARLDTGDLQGVYGSPELEVPWHIGDLSGGYGLSHQIEGIVGRYAYASNFDARIPKRWLPGPAVTTHTMSGTAGTGRAMATMNVNGTETLFAGTGDQVWSTTDGSTWALAKDFNDGSTILSMVVYEGSQGEPFLFVGVDAGNNYWTYSNTDGWTNDADDEGCFFAVEGTRLWKAYRDSGVWKVRNSTTGGEAASWNAAITVGDAAYAVTEMFYYQDRIYVVKEDSMLELNDDSDGFTQELWPTNQADTNSVNGIGYGEFVNRAYIPIDGALYEYRVVGTDQQLMAMGPNLLTQNASDVRGDTTAACGDRDHWLYTVIQNEDGNSFLMAWDIVTGAWHGSLADLGAVTVRKMIVTDKVYADGNPRLLIYADNDILSIILERTGRDRSRDGNCTFATTGHLYFPVFYGRLPFINKAFLAATSLGEDLSSSAYGLLYYRTSVVGSWASIGTNWDTDPPDRVDFPSSGNKSRYMDFRLTVTSPSTSPPVFRDMTVFYQLRPDFKRRMRLRPLLKTQVNRNDSNPDEGATFDSLRTAVLDTLDSAPVTLVGLDGNSYTVTMIPAEASFDPLDWVQDEDYGEVASLVAVEYARVNEPGTTQRLEMLTTGQLEPYTTGGVEVL